MNNKLIQVEVRILYESIPHLIPSLDRFKEYGLYDTITDCVGNSLNILNAYHVDGMYDLGMYCAVALKRETAFLEKLKEHHPIHRDTMRSLIIEHREATIKLEHSILLDLSNEDIEADRKNLARIEQIMEELY